MSAAPHSLETAGLHSHWEDGTACLRDVSVQFPPAARIALLGANGCGKSSLLLALNGSLRASRGAILLDGQPLRYSREALRGWRQRVGLVLCEPDHMLVGGSVASDISFGPINLGLPDTEVRSRVDEAIAAFGLEPWRNCPISSLSFGVKKRLALAGVVAMQPSVLLLDEPSNGLDAPGQAALQASLDRLSQAGCLLVVATHDVDFAWRWATHWLVLEEGHVAYYGLTRHATAYLDTNPAGIAIPAALRGMTREAG